jgi:hypothetical protein
MTGELTWVVWGARANPGRAAGVLGLIVAVCMGVYVSLNSRFYASLGLVVLLIAVLPYFVPTRYTLDEEGVEVSSLLGRRRRPWAKLKAYFPDGERGVLLSPVRDFGLLARTRGTYVPFRAPGPAARDLVARHLPEGRGSTK